MTVLHESLIINILFFLPLKIVIRCKCVCKNWATLIAQPYFIKTYTDHSSNRSAPSSIQFLLHDATNKLFLAQVDEASCTAASAYPPQLSITNKLPLYLKFLKDFYPNPSVVSINICTTCIFTGFIVADAYDRYNATRRQYYYHIFNPITSQHFRVKQFTQRKSSYRCALVFRQKTNQLKLLSFSACDYQIYVITIGTKSSWRSIGSIPFWSEDIQFPTFANGLYHWIVHQKQVICSFDAEKEVFNQIPTPSAIGDFHCSSLAVLDGYLCICMRSYKRSRPIELWVMNEYGIPESWTKKFVLDCNINIHRDRRLGPIKRLDNGEILVICRNLHAGYNIISNLHAICYNPSTTSCKYIEFDGKACMRYTSFPYVPSLRRVLDIDVDFPRQNRRKKNRYRKR